MCTIRKLVSCVLVAVIPCCLLAQDTGGAIISGKGTVWLNGGQVKGSSPMLPGDLIQTKAESIANISMPGSTVLIQPDSLVKFGTKQLFLDQGSLNVGTSQQMSVLAAGATITPEGTSWTEFEVSSHNGSLHVLARKASIKVSCGMDAQTLTEGQQLTRDQSGPCTKEGAGAYPSATGLTSGKHLLEAGIVAGGVGILCLILCGGGGSNPPASASKP